MKKITLFFCAFLLTLSACKKKITSLPLVPAPIAEIPSSDNPSVPDPTPSFVCGGGGFDGTRFYVLKADGRKDYDAYKHTPKTKQELIDLLDKKIPLGTINTYHITNMDSLFYERRDYDFQGIENWMTCKVTTMKSMFEEGGNFNQDLSKWDVGKVTNMRWMFAGCRSFNQPLEKWTVGKATDMGGMFWNCGLFDRDISKWDVSKVTNMGGMFANCSSFNQPLEKWTVGNVTNMKGMFGSCSAFNQDISKWTVANVTDCTDVFWEATEMQKAENKSKWPTFSKCTASE